MKRLAWFTAIVLATVTGLLLLWQFRGAALLFVLAVAVAAAARPGIDYLKRRGLAAWLAIAITYGGGVIVLGFLGYGLVNAFLVELRKAFEAFVATYDHIKAQWPVGNLVQQTIAEALPPPAVLFQSITSTPGGRLLQTGLGITLGFMDFLSRAVVVVVLSVYWEVDGARFERLWLSLLPADQRRAARDTWLAIESGVGSYIRSQLVQGLMAGLLLAFGYWLLGLHYPTLLALAGAVAWLIPLIGGIFAVGFALVIGLLSGPVVATVGAVYTLVVFLLLEILVAPRFYDRRRHNSILTILVMIAMADSVGLFGLLLAPPLATALEILFAELIRDAAPARLPAARAPSISAVSERLSSLQAAVSQLNAAPSPEVAGMLVRLNRLAGRIEDEARAETALPARPQGSPLS